MTINELMEVTTGSITDHVVYIHDNDNVMTRIFFYPVDYKDYKPDYHGEAEVTRVRAVGGHLSIDAKRDLSVEPVRDVFEIMDDMKDLIDEFFDYTDSCKSGPQI